MELQVLMGAEHLQQKGVFMSAHLEYGGVAALTANLTSAPSGQTPGYLQLHPSPFLPLLRDNFILTFTLGAPLRVGVLSQHMEVKHSWPSRLHGSCQNYLSPSSAPKIYWVLYQINV